MAIFHGKLLVYQRVPPDDYKYHISYTIVIINWLVVWNIWIIFPYIRNVIIPTDEVVFFRGVGIPPTSKVINYWLVVSNIFYFP